MLIRPEKDVDLSAIRNIHIAAFANHPYSHQTEHLIVDALRDAGALSVSLVAEIDGDVVGHIAFSPAWIGGRDCNWYVLGPVGVLPELQGRGVGRGLIERGVEALRDRGAKGCVLVGNPVFYRRFGFRNIPELILEGVPAENFMCLPMAEEIPRGIVTHHSVFGVHA